MTGNLLATVCVVWGTFFFLRARRTDRTHDWLVAGAFFGLGVLSRSALVVIPAILVLGLFLSHSPTIRGALSHPLRSSRGVAPFVIAFGLILCPWFVRNSIAFDRPVLGSTLVGYDLYRQNFLLPTSNYLHFVGSAQAGDGIDALLARRTDLTGTETETQMDAVYRTEAVRIIAAHPGRYAMLSLARVPMLWFNWSVQKAYDQPYYASDYIEWCQQALLLATAIAGVWRLRRRAWPLANAVVAVTLVYMPVIGRLYLLLPVMPLVVVLSAVGCAHLVSGRRAMPKMRPDVEPPPSSKCRIRSRPHR